MTKKEVIKLKNIVAFCALMENHDGIIGKSPDYIMEKFNRYCLSDVDECPWGLDVDNRWKVSRWINKWLKKGGE
jgi:hypothetical protein